MSHLQSYADLRQDALNRMRRAADRGTGCHLTSEMIAALDVSIIGEIWRQDDPRTSDGQSTSEKEA